MAILYVILVISFLLNITNLYKYFNEGGNEDMDVIYATLIIHGKRTFDQVPGELLKERVRVVLEDLGFGDLAQ